MSKTPQKTATEEIVNFESKLLGQGLNAGQSIVRGGIRGGYFSRGSRKKKEAIRLGKDEMNLIEHPFGTLWEKEPDDSVMYYEWDISDPTTGKIVPASWSVAGHPDHGLPRGTDERLYLVLMELTREAKFASPIVYFSRHDLLKRLGWNTGKGGYEQLEGALNRLQGVTINAKNAFYNPQNKSYFTVAFNVIDMFRLETMNADGTRNERGPSLWKWSDVLFDSFQSGYIRSLDLDLALSLKSDIALRLYRYLDKKTYDGRKIFEIDLFNLCIGHLGMKPTPYPSKLKERIKPAHEELIARGFLQTVEFQKTRAAGKKSEKVCYSFGDQASKTDPSALPEEKPNDTLLQPGLFDSLPNSVEEEPGGLGESAERSADLTAEQQQLLTRMRHIRVSPAIAHELLDQWPASAILHQLDCLADRKPRNRAATLVKSVREMWALPQEYVARIEAQEAEEKRRAHADQQEAEKTRLRALEAQETARLEEENARLDAMWEKLDVNTRQRIEVEVTAKAGILGQLGRAEAAKVAFRRQALRELLQKAAEG